MSLGSQAMVLYCFLFSWDPRVPYSCCSEHMAPCAGLGLEESSILSKQGEHSRNQATFPSLRRAGIRGKWL